MNTLSFEDASLGAGTNARLENASLSTAAERVALLGDWNPLFDYLLGQRDLDTGQVLLCDEPGRESVIMGRTGIVHPTPRVPPKLSLAGWLEDNLLLCGLSARAAARRSREVLTQLELTHLTKRKPATLTPLELFAARVALALSTEPRLLVVYPTSGEPEALPYERVLLETAAKTSRIVLGCDPLRHLELLPWCDEAIYPCEAPASMDGKRRTLKRFSPAGCLDKHRNYLVTTTQNRDEFERVLLDRDIVIHNPGSNELLVSLSTNADTRQLLLSAAEADAPLVRMIPLF